MSTLSDYKCPNCSGAITFDSALQKMQCPYCEREFEVEALKSYDEEQNTESKEDLEWSTYDENSGSGDWQEGEKDGLLSYSCNSCGGEVVGEAQTAVTKCPYCENTIVITSQFAGMLRPDYVIPFKLDKKQAKEKLKAFYSRKFLLPSAFRSENKIDSITGLYVPFWLFNCETDSVIRYKATKSLTYSDSDYDYVETSHFSVTRGGKIGFNNIPVDGSSKMDDTAMESIEPFSYGELKEFQTAYLAGYIADTYDVTAESAIPRANERIKNSILDILAPKEYETYLVENTDIHLEQGDVGYALFPVWILNTKYKGALHTFVMNGQTGKFSGKLPICIKRAVGYFSSVFTSIVAVSAVVIYFIL